MEVVIVFRAGDQLFQRFAAYICQRKFFDESNFLLSRYLIHKKIVGAKAKRQ